MFEVEEKDRDRQNKYLKYASKMKFYEMRRHNGLVKYVDSFRSKIFEYHMEDIQQAARDSFPELDSEAVNEEVRRMYEDAEKNVNIIKEEPMLVEQLDDHQLSTRKALREN
jgi:CRISPR/Cas system CMR-associated protein Cmr5 small subunit